MCLDGAARSYQSKGIPVSDIRQRFAEAVVKACEMDGFVEFKKKAA